MRECFQTGWAE